MKTTIKNKLRATYPHASEDWITILAEMLSEVVPVLKINLVEWLEDRPFTPIKIHGQYSLTDVLELLGCKDVANALLALDTYARDPSREDVLYPEEVM